MRFSGSKEFCGTIPYQCVSNRTFSSNSNCRNQRYSSYADNSALNGGDDTVTRISSTRIFCAVNFSYQFCWDLSLRNGLGLELCGFVASLFIGKTVLNVKI